MSKKTILICPIGLYKRRLWRAIVKSNADKIYLIKEKKGGYQEITRKIAEEFERDIKEKLLRECDTSESADFTDLEDIYHIFTKIIEKERKINSEATFLIDITSTTKEGALVAGSISAFYRAKITYVPSKAKTRITREELEKEYEWMAKDEGAEPIEIEIPHSASKTSILTEFEKEILKTIYKEDKKTIKVKELANKMGLERNSKELKKCYRYIKLLEEKGLLKAEVKGRSKTFTLTQAGRGIAKGLSTK